MINKCTSRKKPPIKHVFSFAEVLFIPYLQASKPVFLIQSGPVGSLTLSAARETLPPAIRRSRRDWAPTIEANCIGESHRKSSKIHMIVIENHMTQEPPRPQDFSLNPWNRTSYPSKSTRPTNSCPFSCDSSRLRPGWFWGNVSPETMGILMDFDE